MLDLTADEAIVLPPVQREVLHAFTDRPEHGIRILCYAFDEVFGEKLRALAERTRPRDLYDVVHLYRHRDMRPSSARLREVLEQKCAYKGIPVPTLESLEPHRADLEVMWENMLGHQLPALPPVAEFWAALPEVFDWLTGATEAPPLDPMTFDPGTSVLHEEAPLPEASSRARAALERIRFAAANHLCVDLRYDGAVRRIEPYSLRRTAEGALLLHALRHPSGDHRSYRVDRLEGAEVTAQPFRPRYRIELTPVGPLPQQLSGPSSSITGYGPVGTGLRSSHRPSAASKSGAAPTYLYRCSACGKTFARRTMVATLNPHKDSNGRPCIGRLGVFVGQK